MKTVLFILILAVSSNFLVAQNNGSLSKKAQRKLIKEEQKRAAAEKEAQWEKEVEKMMQKNEFVLEADILYDRYGNSRYVNPPMNFILVDSLYSAIQAYNQAFLGRQGIGGEIVEGRIINYRKKKNKKKNSYQIDYVLESPLGAYNIGISISKSGNAEATIRGEFSGLSARYSGKLVSIERYKVFKDRTF